MILRLCLALAALAAALLASSPARAQEWEWALRAGDTTHDVGYAIAVDAAGDVYVTGAFDGSLLAKYDPSGNVLWARSAGGAGGHAVVVDAAGNAYVTGSFFDRATFGAFTLTSAGSADVFVVKYAPSGDVLWARSAGGADRDRGWGIAMGTAGNAYVTGSFFETATFGAFTLTGAGNEDVFVVKYGPTGDVLWAQRSGGDGHYDECNGIAVNDAGDAYVTGRFGGPDGATSTFGPFTLTSVGASDAFVTRLGGSGTAAEGDPTGAEALHLSPFAPHPAAARATATLRARYGQRVRVALHDVLGRELSLVFDGVLVAGVPRSVEVDASALAPGVYVLRVVGKGATLARRLVVAR